MLGRACLSRALIVGHPEAELRRIDVGDNASSAARPALEAKPVHFSPQKAGREVSIHSGSVHLGSWCPNVVARESR